MEKICRFLDALDADRLLRNEPMSRHTTFRVGGTADNLFFPENEGEIVELMTLAREAELPCMVIGNGSNIIVREGGIRGLVLALGERFGKIERSGTRIKAQAGALLSRVAFAAQEAGLSGLEFASGIPGTLGGGCAMNAGAYGGQLSDVLVSAEVILNGERKTLTLNEMEMGYRSTLPLREGGVVLSAEFELHPDAPEKILSRMRELNARRREKQPLNLPSAGSIFKRPEGNYAGSLIEQCGLKGLTVGGAQVSPKHAGFIVNVGGATADDIEALIEQIRRTVYEKTGILLEPEARILGEK